MRIYRTMAVLKQAGRGLLCRDSQWPLLCCVSARARHSHREPPACPPASSQAVSAGVHVKVAGLGSASASHTLGTEFPIGLAWKAGGGWVDEPGGRKEGLLDGVSHRS